MHPIMGLNFRISELHAAVGLAQLRKLDLILERQRKVKGVLKEGLRGLEGLSFREVPDRRGVSARLLRFFLPTEGAAREASLLLGAAGVDGCFYWYDNNWHYHRRWEHFKRLVSPAALAVQKAGWLETLEGIEVPESDALMGRTICMLIKLGWTDEQVEERLGKMRSVLGGR